MDDRIVELIEITARIDERVGQLHNVLYKNGLTKKIYEVADWVTKFESSRELSCPIEQREKEKAVEIDTTKHKRRTVLLYGSMVAIALISAVPAWVALLGG